MALVTTTVVPDLRLTPFTGISEVARERSGIARAEVVYTAVGTWPATGAGDNRSISFNFELDPAYGYVLMDANAAFIKYADDKNSMEATGVMQISTVSASGGEESQWYSYISNSARQTSAGNTAIGSIGANDYNTMFPITGNNSIIVFTMETKPTALLFPFPGVDAMACTSMFGEHKAQEGSQAYRFYMRFLQYDIVQGYNYIVNSPIMTRG